MIFSRISLRVRGAFGKAPRDKCGRIERPSTKSFGQTRRCQTQLTLITCLRVLPLNEIHESHTLCKPLRLLVDMRFQFYFTPLTGVIFTFPSRYLFTIDLKKYVALPVSSGKFTRAIHVSGYSRTTAIEMLRFRIRGYYPLGRAFPGTSSN